MTQTGKLIASDVDIGDYFGTSESIFGNLIVVGAPYDDDYCNLSGSVYFFQLISFHDDEPPKISCIGNTTRNLLQRETVYLVSGTEFDPVDSGDNIGIATLINDFNLKATLDGAGFPVGITNVTWTFLDSSGNEAECSFEVTVTASTGIDLNLNPLVRNYPNPTCELLTIQTAEPGIYSVELKQSNGRIIDAFCFQGQLHQIDLSSYQKGVYFISIRTNNFVITGRIIKRVMLYAVQTTLTMGL